MLEWANGCHPPAADVGSAPEANTSDDGLVALLHNTCDQKHTDIGLTLLIVILYIYITVCICFLTKTK